MIKRANYYTTDSSIYTITLFVGYCNNIIKYNDINYIYIVYSPGNKREITSGGRAVFIID